MLLNSDVNVTATEGVDWQIDTSPACLKPSSSSHESLLKNGATTSVG